MPGDLPDWTRQAVSTQTVVGTVGPVGNNGVVAANLSIPKGTQAIGLRTASTGGLGPTTLFQVQGVTSRVMYFNAQGNQLPAAIAWVLIDSIEDVQVTLTITTPASPAGTASAWLIASSAPLTPSQVDPSDRPARQLGVLTGPSLTGAVGLATTAAWTQLLAASALRKRFQVWNNTSLGCLVATGAQDHPFGLPAGATYVETEPCWTGVVSAWVESTTAFDATLTVGVYALEQT